MAQDVDIDAIADGGEDLTLSDDLMPNEGSAFDSEQEEDRSPENDTRAEANAEAEMILGSAPIMGHLNEWFMEEIKATDSIAAALNIAEAYKITDREALVVMDVIAKVLEVKRLNIDTLKRIYIDKTES